MTYHDEASADAELLLAGAFLLLVRGNLINHASHNCSRLLTSQANYEKFREVMIFPKKIETLRAKRGWSQRAFAAALREAGIDVSQRAVSGWESGAVPRPDIAKKLADFFDLSLETLMDDSRDLASVVFDELRAVAADAEGVAEGLADPKDAAVHAALDLHAKTRQQNKKTVQQLRAWAKQLTAQAMEISHLANQLEASSLQTEYPITLKKPKT